MFSTLVALGTGGALALFVAPFGPKRWPAPHRIEVSFALLFCALGVYVAISPATCRWECTGCKFSPEPGLRNRVDSTACGAEAAQAARFCGGQGSRLLNSA